ncbi:hypothetical protein ACFQ0O_28895 [Saccharopolyspora spinosporotrichia]
MDDLVFPEAIRGPGSTPSTGSIDADLPGTSSAVKSDAASSGSSWAASTATANLHNWSRPRSHAAPSTCACGGGMTPLSADASATTSGAGPPPAQPDSATAAERTTTVRALPITLAS